MKLPAFLRLSPKWAPYVFVSPFLVLFGVFGVFPLCFSLYLAFQSWEPTGGLKAMEFVGLANFKFALHDTWFWTALKNTLWLAIAAGVPQHLVALPLAAFIHTSFKRLRDGVIAVYFLPYITSTVAISIMFNALFSKDYGMINAALAQLFGMSHVDWLHDVGHIKPAIAFIVFWRYVGFNTVLYLAAMQTIPGELYEAATLDHANRWRQFIHITLPSIKPMIFFGVTLSVIGGLQLFEEPFILTGGKGGPQQAAMTSAVYLFREAFDFNDFGGASAMSWLLFVVVALLTWLTNIAFRSRKGQA